jgi:hypothetical protein
MNRILNELLVRRRRASSTQNTFSFVVDQHTHTHFSRVVIYIFMRKHAQYVCALKRENFIQFDDPFLLHKIVDASRKSKERERESVPVLFPSSCRAKKAVARSRRKPCQS